MPCCQCCRSKFQFCSFEIRAPRLLRNPPLRFREIRPIDFKSDKFLHTAALCCDRGISDAEKRIEHAVDVRRFMQL